MLELLYVRENLEWVRQKMRERGVADLLGNFEELDYNRRRLLSEVEQRKAHRNKSSEQIAVLKKQKQDASPLIKEMRQLNEEIKGLEQQVSQAEKRVQDLLLGIPNIPHSQFP